MRTRSRKILFFFVMELFLSLTCHPCYDHSFKSYLKEKFWEGLWEREQGKRFRKIAKGGEGEHEKRLYPNRSKNCICCSKIKAILLKWWILAIGGVALGRVCACSLHSMFVLKQTKKNYNFNPNFGVPRLRHHFGS